MTSSSMNRRPHFGLIVLLFFLSHFGVAQNEAVPEKVLDLSQALQYATKNAPELQAQFERLRISELQKLNARSALWPSLSFQSLIGEGSGTRLDETSQALNSSSIGLSINLLNSGRDWTAFQVATHSEELAEVQSREFIESYSLQIYKAFSTYSRQKALVEIAEKRTATVTDQYQRVRRSYRAGSRARGDFLRFQAQQKRAQIALDRARSDVKLAEDEIKRLIGISLEANYSFKPLPLQLDSTPVSELRPIAITEHNLNQIQQIQIEIEKENLQQSKFELLPSASLNAGLIQNFGTAHFTDEIGQGWQAGLSLSYDLFDFGENQRNLEISKSQVSIATTSLANTNLSLQSQLSALKINIEQSLTELKLSQELLEIDSTTFDRISTQYQRGQSSYLEYIEALNNFLLARSSVIQSSYEYRELLAEWKYHQGKIYATYANP